MADYEMPPYHLDDNENTRLDMTPTTATKDSAKQNMAPREEIASVARSIMLSSKVAAGDRLEAARVYGRLHGIDVDQPDNEKGNARLLNE